jgi:hypothetical protein
MQTRDRIRIAALTLIVLSSYPVIGRAAEIESLRIPVEFWDRPRSGATFITLAEVKQAIGTMLARPQAGVVIRHPPGTESVLQAEELRAWLIAHAIEPHRIALRADLAPRSALLLEVGHKR